MPNRSPSPSSLPDGISPISESDYFLKNTEFRVWLKDERSKYFDELSSEKARSYFRKFVRAWNKGKLSTALYHDAAAIAGPAANQTAYKWSFATKDASARRTAREHVAADTLGTQLGGGDTNTNINTNSNSGGRVIGPARPSASDLVLARETASEYHASERELKRKRDRAEAKDRLEDAIGPKAVGREGMLEKKRARRESDRAFRDKGDEGYEADESMLLGGGDSFKAHVARRDAARKRFEEKRIATREDKAETSRDRVTAMREKDKATMDMFQQLAKQRFG